MKNLFILLILFPLFISIKFPWEWNWDISLDFDQFLENIKSGIPEFINELKGNLSEFLSKTYEQKQEIIENLKNASIEEFNKINDNKEENFAKFIEYTTEAAQYMSYQICNSTNITSYNECRKNKKEVFTQLITQVHDKFQCSQIITIVTSHILAGNINSSLKYLLFLVNSVTKNPDAIEKTKIKAVYELLYCVEEKLDEYLPTIESNFTNKTKYLEFKKDITSLLIQSTENLVPIIHFEELDDYIEEANKKTGLIPDEKAKIIHQHIFKNLQKLNEFGSCFYNLSATLAVNVTIKPKELNLKEEIVTDFPDKGIRIVLHSDKLFKEYREAYSIQTVVFDSPLVSIRGGREKEGGGTANTFVGITIYKSDGSVLAVDNIKMEELRPIIYYKKSLYNAMTTCLYYNEDENMTEDNGISTKEVKIDEEKYIRCIPKHLTSFTIGSYKTSKGSIAGKVILSIFICLVIISIAFLGYYFWRKRALKENSSQMNQAFPNKDGLLI